MTPFACCRPHHPGPSEAMCHLLLASAQQADVHTSSRLDATGIPRSAVHQCIAHLAQTLCTTGTRPISLYAEAHA